MAIYEYGVTPSVLAGYAHSLPITASTSPTSTQVESMITDRAAEIGGVLDGLGYDLATLEAATTSAAYRVVRRWIIVSALYDCLRARERVAGPTVALMESYRLESDRLMERIQTMPVTLGDHWPSSAGSPNIPDSHVSRSTQIEASVDAASTSTQLGRRLAWKGQL